MDPNPWLDLPTVAPFVLRCDGEQVGAFNGKATANHRVETALLPEPYVGCVDAPVVVLLNNPGFAPEDVEQHQSAAFRERVRACHRQDPMLYPHYYLEPCGPAAKGGGARWWLGNTKVLVERFDLRTVARGVVCFEFFPYHSRQFAHRRLRVPSQQYTFELLRSALQRKAVVLPRGWKDWTDAVPELRDYPLAFRPNASMGFFMTPNNFREGFEAACDALQAMAPERCTISDDLASRISATEQPLTAEDLALVTKEAARTFE